MTHFRSTDEILDFAISEEETAAEFYTHLARTMDNAWICRVFEDFATEEVVHKQKLLLVKEDKLLLPAEDQIMDLRRSDYLVDVQPSETLEYRDVLDLAMDKEKAAFKLYNDLAESTEDATLRSMFLALAEEEAKHKLRFEVEYEKHFNHHS
jgi:rubrerythrin